MKNYFCFFALTCCFLGSNLGFAEKRVETSNEKQAKEIVENVNTSYAKKLEVAKAQLKDASEEERKFWEAKVSELEKEARLRAQLSSITSGESNAASSSSDSNVNSSLNNQNTHQGAGSSKSERYKSAAKHTEKARANRDQMMDYFKTTLSGEELALLENTEKQIKGNKEIEDGQEIDIIGTNKEKGSFMIKLYDYNSPRYNPFIINIGYV
jgi:hypothetical protein